MVVVVYCCWIIMRIGLLVLFCSFDDWIHIRIEQEYSMIVLKMVSVEVMVLLLLVVHLLVFLEINPSKIVCSQH